MAHQKFRKIFMAHQYMPKIFHGPHKNPPTSPPTYLMCGPLILSWRVFHEVCMKPKVDFWIPFLLCTHMYTFGITPSPTYDAYIIFLPTNPLHHHLIQNVCNLSFKKLQNIKSTLNQFKNYLKTIEGIFLFFTQWLQRKYDEFSPTYLYLVGNYLTSFLGHLALLEIYQGFLLWMFCY